MATILAQATGNWSNAATWAGGVLPGAGGATDDADSNGYTVTIDQDINLNGGALIGTNAGGGGFVCSTARSIMANITATVRKILILSHTSGNTITITGNILAGTSASTLYGVENTSTGRLDVVGNVTGRGSIGLHGGFVTGILNVTGTVTGGSSGNDAYGIRLYWGAVSIIGNVYGGSFTNCTGIRTTGATLTVTGNAYATGNLSGIEIGTGTLVLNGNAYGSTTGMGSGITTTGGTVTINGNAYGNGSTSQFGGGVYNSHATAVVTINGNAVGGATGGYGANNANTGTIICDTVVAGLVVAGMYGQNSNGSTRAKKLEWASNGMSPVYGHFKVIPDGAINYAQVVRSDTGAALKLNWDHPAVGDVRLGTSYDLAAKTGTMSGGAVSISPALGGGIG